MIETLNYSYFSQSTSRYSSYKTVRFTYRIKEKEAIILNKNDGKDSRKNAPKSNNPGQPEPLSGSHKVKNRNHSRQKHNSSHDM